MDYFFRGLGARDLFLINCGRWFGIFAVAVFVDSGGGVDAVIASGRAERFNSSSFRCKRNNNDRS